MRIDKYLKVSRVIKRRAVAADACDGGRIEINGKSAKPAKEIKVGDIVTVAFGDKKLTFKVLFLDEKASKANAKEMYEIVEN
ncbi:MAG: RNA-binding S4 domain-containing protein [Clostridia bacterium]|nr:RNA-binding S4 domain-containing protein [Clostridia bacterium]